MSGLVNDGMDKGSMMESEDRIEKTVDIYISAEAVRDMKHKKDTEDFNTKTAKTQTPQHAGSDSVMNRSSRAALVCLVLLCVLLLTAVIVLCVYIHTKSTNYTEETQQLLTNITNLTDERDQLLTNITNLTDERNQLLTNITNLTDERVQLLNEISNITKERVQLISKNENLTNERVRLRNVLQIYAGWTSDQSSFYYISKEKKSSNESKRYCTERGADLITINNIEEQDFVKNMSGAAIVWIGLADSVVEGTWKWADGSALTFTSWASKEPNGGTSENCAVNVAVPKLPEWPGLVGWLDESCNKAHQWICEKNISQLILP